ncbi:YCF48-related protein [Seonamhaeicola marinus]|uniref:T9SS type A sorting domain-containing protein n=1 Tax=Seonamhaeicola marinus TaxID=1912246 RepID=A0A5D0IKH1_9FLAO|nr:YCF48-related protein [Seonamhaeicola marinus]TYA84403.1 T9SS type A sorting domain-containing protein [Seonamhaeicola marinus]
MKLIKLLIFLIGFIAFAQPSWKEVPNLTTANTPTNGGPRFDDVYFLNKNTGWAANGWHAAVFKTEDGGLTWTEQLNEQQLNSNGLTGDFYFRNVEFLNENIGFLGTLFNSASLLKTIDGGENWTQVSNITPQPGPICGLNTVGSSTVFGCGAYSEPAYIIKSTDSGDTWQYTDMSAHATGLVEIKFISETIGYAAGKNSSGAVILKTTNGGNTWSEIFNSGIAGEYVWKLQVLDSDNDIIFGSVEAVAPNPGKVIKSTNAGASWISNDAPDSILQAVGFINENRGWVGGHNTGFHETNDGGQTWTNLNIGFNLNRIFIIDSDTGFAAGTSVYKFTSEALSTETFDGIHGGNPLKIDLNKNPIDDLLEITIEFQKADNLLINLHDINGRHLIKLTKDIIAKQSKKEYKFDVNQLSAGTYILDFHHNLGRVSKKFVKK